MDSWSLQGESYSVTRSAPRTFSLCNREGTPNHVEIYDIINIPTQRSAISETTCLCEIFGDDVDLASVSSSPPSTFLPSQGEVEGRVAVSPQVDDLNDSSGSYHTAQGSSEGEGGFEDSIGKLLSPLCQHNCSEGKEENCKSLGFDPSPLGDSPPSIQLNELKPTLQIKASRPSSDTSTIQALSSAERTSSPGYNSSSRANSETIPLSLSYSAAEKELSVSSDVSQPYTQAESRSISPSVKNSQSGQGDQSLSPSPTILQHSLEPKAGTTNQKSPSPPASFCQDYKDLDFKFKSVSPSASSSASFFELESPSEEAQVSPRLSENCSILLSPFFEEKGRIFIPDLFSRGSTPDINSANFGFQVQEASTGLFTTTTTPQEGIRTKVVSPVSSYSFPPSPGDRYSGSPIEQRYCSPSPEIALSPEVERKQQLSQANTGSTSPILQEHISSNYPRSLNSSPHITEISYSVVQPEDRKSPTFPEISRVCSKAKNKPPESCETDKDSVHRSGAESTASEQTSPLFSDFPSCASECDDPLIQPNDKQPSHLLNNLFTSPEPVFQTFSTDEIHGTSSLQRNRDLSPEGIFPEKKYSITEATSARGTPGTETDSIAANITVSPPSEHLPKDSLFDLDRGEVVHIPKIKSNTSLVAIRSAASNSDKTSHLSQIQHTTDAEEKIQKEHLQDIPSSLSPHQEKIQVESFLFQEEHIKVHSPDLIATKERNLHISPTHCASPNQSVQSKDLTLLFTSFPLNCNKISYSPDCIQTPGNPKQLLTKVKRGDRVRFSEDMSKHEYRRRTPSPPLTRFTPVHIIPPEKPRRKWQNRRHSSSQEIASSQNVCLRKPAANQEIPNADPVDTDSQAQWARLGRQLELDGEIPQQQDRDVGMKSEADRELDRECQREERVPERGEGWRVGSYRGEQVELSFSARNRKGPASCSPAPTSKEGRQGLPTAHSYSESLSETRQPQQQQSLLKLSSQQDNRTGNSGRKFHPPVAQDRKVAPRRVALNRPCRSSSSSMGSELDEEDNEVKWLTDWAFRSLSSPEVDYLEMYNSSHCSSTNISQPSTHDSPAGINAAWLAYADLRGSVPTLDHDELSFHQLSAHNLDGLDQSRQYELGSFECIDVAIEREESRKMRRGVPKRQIQLKKKNNECRQDESSENSSPGLPVMVESPSHEKHSRAAFVRQHSTPAAMQECYPAADNSYFSQEKQRCAKLQKSASMDETSSKTKMASCLIKNVLSKKMQRDDRKPDEQTCEVSSPIEETPLKKSQRPDSCNLSSSFQSDHSLSSESIPVKSDPGSKDQSKLRSSNRPGSSSSSRSVSFSQADSADSQSRSGRLSISEIKSELTVPFEGNTFRTRLQQSKNSQIEVDDSNNAANFATGAPFTNRAYNTQERDTNQESETTECNKKLLQEDEDACTLKTRDLTLKAAEKKKTSLNFCLTPETETKSFLCDASVKDKEEKTETNTNVKIEVEEEENNTVKSPIHKVRDVRRLVKNTYNLSFEASDSVSPTNVSGDRMEKFYEENPKDTSKEERNSTHGMTKKERRGMEEEELIERQRKVNGVSQMVDLLQPAKDKANSQSGPQPMQIQCKAVCLKDNKIETSIVKKKDLDNNLQVLSESFEEAKKESMALSSNNLAHTAADKEIHGFGKHGLNMQLDKQEKMTETERPEQKPLMLRSLPKQPNKEREVSTAVVLIRERSTKPISVSASQVDTPPPVQATASSPLLPEIPSTNTLAGSGGHSVSMLLKEKGYQADIGAVVGNVQSTRGNKVSCKHVNSLEIPLQTISEGDFVESHRQRTLSCSSGASGHSALSDNKGVLKVPGEDEKMSRRNPEKEKQNVNSSNQKISFQQQKDLGDFEAVKRFDPTFPPRSPAVRRFKAHPSEAKTLSKKLDNEEDPTNSIGNFKPQSIEVKSIAKHSQKPVVPPKPNCKLKNTDLGVISKEAQRKLSNEKPPGEERLQTIVVSSPTVYRKISNESMSTTNYSKKLSVSAVSSLKPPPHKTQAETVSGFSNQSVERSDINTFVKRDQQSVSSLQGPRHTQKHVSVIKTPLAESDMASAQVLTSDPNYNKISGLSGASRIQTVDSGLQPQCTAETWTREQTIPVNSNNTVQHGKQRNAHQPCRRSLSDECPQRIEEQLVYASDDPPSYDERESFSPLLVQELTPMRSNWYPPSSRPPLCSCMTGYPPDAGTNSPLHHCSPYSLSPPVSSHSPGHAKPFQMTQPPPHPHQCKPESKQLNYQPGSSKSSPVGPNQPSSAYQHIHQSGPCHPSLMQACPAERPLLPSHHVGVRRPPAHRSPLQHLPTLGGAPCGDLGHSHSPGLLDPQYLCGTQSTVPCYGSDYGGDSSSLFSESSYGQTPRRVLVDPESGKYFYIEVPVQPLRKMLFDPEIGQYVEVLIPQQSVPHSGLYPPSTAPFGPLHNPNIYASASQYLSCGASHSLAHPHAQPQPPQYPEAPPAASLQSSVPSVNYRNLSRQVSKPEPKIHPPMDQRYPDSMYYTSTGMDACQNPTPPDYYHKHPASLPPTGGKRS